MKKHAVEFICACITFVFFHLTRSASLGFADDAEFALVTKLGSVAHPPGFPAYVYIGWIWGKFMSLFSADHVYNMQLLSILSSSIMAFMLCKTVTMALAQTNQGKIDHFHLRIIGGISTLVVCTGMTVWLWSNAVEVYAFHLLSAVIMLYGLVRFQAYRNLTSLFIAGIGLGLGLANHHLTLILFMPFAVFFFGSSLFRDDPEEVHSVKASFQNIYPYFMGVVAGLIVVFFYVLMYIRAQYAYPFEFGNPDTIGRMFYHISGGSWGEQTMQQVDGIVGLRFPYFMRLILHQYLIFLPAVVFGMACMIIQKLYRLLGLTFGYFLLVLLYQLRIYQFADTDTYMLVPFVMGAIWIAYGIYWVATQRYLVWLAVVVLLPIQLYLNFGKADKSDYSISETHMKEIDRSCPPNSILITSDWTTLMQYYYYRVAENFRPDLIVLKGSVKFTNYEMLPLMYPELYLKVKDEYLAYIEEIRKVKPIQVYDTGVDMVSRDLVAAYTKLMHRIIRLADAEDRPFLREASTFLFHAQNGITTYEATFSGAYLSNVETTAEPEILNMDYDWLNSRLLMYDPAAVNTIERLEVLFDFYRTTHNDPREGEIYNLAQSAFAEIHIVLNNMKARMPFIQAAKEE